MSEGIRAEFAMALEFWIGGGGQSFVDGDLGEVKVGQTAEQPDGT
jgi:hypothetical protein